MIRCIITAIIFLIGSGAYSADNKSIIRGIITDKNSREPLAGVYVIYGRNAGTISDEKGFYKIATDLEKLSVTFQLIGYESITKDIIIGANDTLELNVELEMKIREIDQIVVSADKIEKRVAEHNNGKSLSTKGKRPWRLVYNEKYLTRSEAASREKYLKSVKGRLELKAKGIL